MEKYLLRLCPELKTKKTTTPNYNTQLVGSHHKSSSQWPPAPTIPTPRVWPRSQNENSGRYILCLLFVKTQTQFGIKIFETDFVNKISWYLAFWLHPKITSSTLGWNFYAFCSPHDHIRKLFLTPWVPQVPPWCMTQGSEQKSRLICFISSIRKNTYTV